MGSPYRDAPPPVERMALDDAARARVEAAIGSATRRILVCAMILIAFATFVWGSRGILLVIFPLDFLAIGVAIELGLELRHLQRARADLAGGLVRAEGELRWRRVAYRLLLDDGRLYWHDGPLGRWQATVLPRLGEVVHAQLVAEAEAREAAAAQDEAMDAILGVTPETWSQNQAGQLTTAQRLRLARGAAWLLPLIGFVVWLALDGAAWRSLWLAIPMLALAWVGALRLWAALAGRARTLEGVVTAEQRGGKYPRYYLCVGNERVEADVLVWKAFRRAGQRHRVIACTVDPQVIAVRALD